MVDTRPLDRRRDVARLYGDPVPPAPAPVTRTPEPEPTPALKGAVKVSEFPERCRYPFPAIARDGGIWKIDPAELNAKAESIRSAAWQWAKQHGVKAKVVIDDGFAYVQFTSGGDDARG